MALGVAELNQTNCKTYLVWSAGEAALIDPVRERVETYRSELKNRGLSLKFVLETHMHADHVMFDRDILLALGAAMVMHEASPSPLVSRHVKDGDILAIGNDTLKVVHTPGHTPDSVCYVAPGMAFTGDTLLIGGSGRTDFPGGDAGQQFDAVKNRILTLPDDTVIYPAHDYRGLVTSTVGSERQNNPRFAGMTRDRYIQVMGNLNLPLPDKVQESLQVNQSGFFAGEVMFPSVAELKEAESVSAAVVADWLTGNDPPILLDVREPEEFVGELGHIAGALLVPLDALATRLPKLLGYVDRRVVCVCRAGARSASACAILRRSGFSKVFNLDNGMLGWVQAKKSVQK